MGKIFIQKNFYNYEKHINEERKRSLTSNNPLSKSARFYNSFYNVVNVPRNPSVKRSKPIVPWKPSQGTIAQWKANSPIGPIANGLKNVHNPDNIPQKNAFHSRARDSSAPGIANKKQCNHGADHDCLEDATEFNKMDKPVENEIYHASGIKISSEMQPTPDYRDADYPQRLNDYILNTIIPKVNQPGKAPLWLRPLAAIAAWFGYHGVGQTNCLSCAASVADTLKQRVLHLAFPTLRGSSPSMFSTLRKAQNTGGVKPIDSIEDLAAYLNSSRANLNIVLTINRPKSFWRRLFNSVDGHACNIIRTGEYLHLVDAQQRRYNLVNMTSANRLSKDLITALYEFIGAVSPEERSLMLYNVGW